MSLDAIGIACKDVNETMRFYNLLGVEFQEFGKGHFEGKTPSGVRIMLDSFELMKEINPDWKEPGESGIVLCFLQSSASEVDDTFQKIKGAGFQFVKEPWDAFWGQRYSSVKDPNGNQVDIFANLEE